MAMLDGLELALRLAANFDWSEAVVDYEERMFVRAASAAAGAMEGLAFVSEDALAHVLGHFQSMQDPAGGDVRRPGMSTPQEMFETRIAEKTRNADAQNQVNAVYRFALSGPNGGTWIVDFKAGTYGVRQGDEAGQCTVAMTDDDFLAMLAGEFTPRRAFMSGKLKVKGDMGLAMKLGQVLAV